MVLVDCTPWLELEAASGHGMAESQRRRKITVIFAGTTANTTEKNLAMMADQQCQRYDAAGVVVAK